MVWSSRYCKFCECKIGNKSRNDTGYCKPCRGFFYWIDRRYGTRFLTYEEATKTLRKQLIPLYNAVNLG